MAEGAKFFRVGDEVAAALEGHRRVVAFESTIFSGLGLPSPANRECFDRCVTAVRDGGAVPALTAVVDGVAVVGVETSDLDRVFAGTRKVAARDLAGAVSGGLDVGVTTVSASLTLVARAGIEVFATGGIGGVHRGAEVTGDVSGDLVALSRHRVVTVSAGAKAFLDLPRTLEYLETLAVPVVGWQTDRFPAFYVRDSGLDVPTVVNSGDDVAAMLRASAALGHPGGILVANPIPVGAELDPEPIDRALGSALALVEQRSLRGPAVTPVLLDAIAAATDGVSVEANLALAQDNARVAAEIAAALAR
ncbi:MAG: pseudouridine-5'-phosphate glycosidase [Acidimicrobiaceae bacterium]|nr:pseudouridine-5'-phosphate glycosidase [Acidimicrobiaceae bacterium]MDE0607504.1 pseudouridine-5'-phosphate glycosidase [Acidimicrobiaceae bacterium]